MPSGVSKKNEWTRMDKPLKVFIVDDDPSGASLLATLLGMEGHQAFPAKNWREPLVELVERRPNVVLVDVRLWSRSGFDLLKQIREHQDPEVARTPVLMMSAEDHRSVILPQLYGKNSASVGVSSVTLVS